MVNFGVRRAVGVVSAAIITTSIVPWTGASAEVRQAGGDQSKSGQLPVPLQKSLKPLAIASAVVDGSVLKINTRKPVVTRDTFRFIVKMGVCYPIWNDARNGWGSTAITRVEVRNDIGVQGFAFNGGRKECAELGKSENSDAEDKYVDAHTLVCIAGNPCRPRRPGEVIAGDS